MLQRKGKIKRDKQIIAYLSVSYFPKMQVWIDACRVILEAAEWLQINDYEGTDIRYVEESLQCVQENRLKIWCFVQFAIEA